MEDSVDIVTETVLLSSGHRMPVVGLGTWQLMMPQLEAVIKEAVLRGCRLFDCAAIYGNEKEVGAIFKSIFADYETYKVRREDVFIVSKLWCTMHAPEDVHKACKKSLEDLQLDYLDLYLIHWPFSFERDSDGFSLKDANGVAIIKEVSTVDTWKAMEDLVLQGSVRSIGVSNFTIKHLAGLLSSPAIRIQPAANEYEMHPYLPQPELLAFCLKNTINAIGYSSLGSGKSEPSLLGDEHVAAIAKEEEMSPAQLLLSWVVTRGAIAIPKMSSIGRVSENFTLRHLSESIMERINLVVSAKVHFRYVNPADFWKRDCFDEDC